MLQRFALYVRDLGFPIVVAGVCLYSTLVSVPASFDRLIASNQKIADRDEALMQQLLVSQSKLGEQLTRVLEKLAR